MKTFTCHCGNTIFFENSQCVACGSAQGWCPICRRMTSLIDVHGQLQCSNNACNALLVKCTNYSVHEVCNRCCAIDENGPGQDNEVLCDYCRFNETVPDLTIPGNRELWQRLEEAKRRLLYTMDLLSVPYGNAQDGIEPALTFDFKADSLKKDGWWWSTGKEEPVYTGHAEGKITINLREADTVEREKSRVLFQEAHRTVIGHFRHEMGHYFWQLLVHGEGEADFKRTFGDHQHPAYDQAQETYYANGPPPDWPSNYVSAYAAMHPWEDFAETFATYIDMVSVLDTARHMRLPETCDPIHAKLSTMVRHYIRLGVVLNELNRAMGLTDVVPEIFVPPVVRKMGFVHALIRHAQIRQSSA